MLDINQADGKVRQTGNKLRDVGYQINEIEKGLRLREANLQQSFSSIFSDVISYKK